MSDPNVEKVRSFFFAVQELMRQHGIDEVDQTAPEFELTTTTVDGLGVEIGGVEYKIFDNSIFIKGSREGLAWNEQTPHIQVGSLKAK